MDIADPIEERDIAKLIKMMDDERVQLKIKCMIEEYANHKIVNVLC